MAYLDLSYYPTDAQIEAGPAACVAGELKLVPGQFGMPSQVTVSIAFPHSSGNDLHIRLPLGTTDAHDTLRCLTPGISPEHADNCDNIAQVVFTPSSLRALQLSHFNEERNAYELLPDALDLDRQKLTLMLPLHKATNVISLELRGHCLN